MTDDFPEYLRRLDRYPGRGNRLDPALVVRAGRRRRAARRTAGATAACAVVAALAFGVTPLVDRSADDRTVPVTTPGPTTSVGPTTTPSPTPSPTGYPGISTFPAPLSDPVGAGVLGVPATPSDVNGVPVWIIGPGDGTVLPVAVTPTAYDAQSQVAPAYRSGFGLWTPGGSIDWITKPPSTPTRGAQTVEAAVSADWVVWFESDFANSGESPYVLWARPRSGGQAREIARSPQTPGIWDHHPVIVGSTLFWVDAASDGNGSTTVMLSAPLDGSRPARIEMRGVTALTPDRCSKDGPALFVVTGTNENATQGVHRLAVDGSGSIVSDQAADAMLGTAGALRGVAACGATVAVAHDIDADSASRSSWLQIDQSDGSARTVGWPKGSDSSIGDLAVGPGAVTWRLYNGWYDSDAYLFDLASKTLYWFPAAQDVRTDGTYLWWIQRTPGSDRYRPVAARVAAR